MCVREEKKIKMRYENILRHVFFKKLLIKETFFCILCSPNLFILLYLAVPLLAQHTLLEFREISTIKLSVGHEKIQISINDIFSDMEMFMNDVESFNCTSDDCDKGKSLLIEALQLKNTTIRSIFSDQQNLIRKKRSWDPIGKGLKWMSGVMDSDDRASLNRKVNILYDNQKTIYNQLESLLSKPELLKAENAAEFVEVESELKHVQELIGLQRYCEFIIYFLCNIYEKIK